MMPEGLLSKVPPPLKYRAGRPHLLVTTIAPVCMVLVQTTKAKRNASCPCCRTFLIRGVEEKLAGRRMGYRDGPLTVRIEVMSE